MRSRKVFLVLACLLAAAKPATAVNVWTYHNDNPRTGANLSETALTLSNVNVNSFGKLFTCELDGQPFAQPLLLSDVALPDGSRHNIVYVATENDTVYAFDADGPDRDKAGQCVPLWKNDFTDEGSGITPAKSGTDGICGDIVPNLGITATPVIDVSAGTLYVVVKTKEVRGSDNHYVHRLYALNVATGDVTMPPTFIGDTMRVGSGYQNDTAVWSCGCASNSDGGEVCSDESCAACPVCPDGNVRVVKFNALRAHERTGLVLANGVVYLTFASHCDGGPYHGWVVAFDASTLQQLAVLNTTPDLHQGGVWQGGGAPAVDSDGYVYFTTGNADRSGADFSFPPADSVYKMQYAAGALSLTDSFTPWQSTRLRGADRDLSSGGVLVLPPQSGAHPKVLITAGKENTIYLLDRGDLGGYGRRQPCDVFTADCDDVLTELPWPDYSTGGETNSIPAYVSNGTDQFVFYLPGAFGPNRLHLQRYKVTSDPPSITQVADADPPIGFPSKGGIPSLSAHPADEAGNLDAIVWVIQESAPAVLRAYDALSADPRSTPQTMIELYGSDQDPRDRMGNGLKFSLPTVANGKVYCGTAKPGSLTGEGFLEVFGLLP